MSEQLPNSFEFYLSRDDTTNASTSIFSLINLLLKFYGSAVDWQCCDHFCCAARGFIYACPHKHSPSESFPTQISTEYWVEFPGLYSRCLSAIYYWSHGLELTKKKQKKIHEGTTLYRDKCFEAETCQKTQPQHKELLFQEDAMTEICLDLQTKVSSASTASSYICDELWCFIVGQWSRRPQAHFLP